MKTDIVEMKKKDINVNSGAECFQNLGLKSDH